MTVKLFSTLLFVLFSFCSLSLFFFLRFASIPIYSSFSLVFSIFFRCVYSFFYVPIKSHGNMYNTPTTLMWFIVSFLEFAFDTRNHPISKLTIGNLASKKISCISIIFISLIECGIWCWDSKTVGIRSENAFKIKLVFTEYILFTFRLLFFISSKLKTTAYWPAFQQSNRKKIRKFGFLNLTFRIFTYFKASHFPCEKSKQIFMLVRLLMNVWYCKFDSWKIPKK